MEITATHTTPDLADPPILSEGATPAHKGGQTSKKRTPYQVAGSSYTPTTSLLADQTIAGLQHVFNGREHYPSADMWEALRAAAETMEAMAEGRCPDLIHVSSLDPGVGKTSVVVCFLRVLLASGAHANVAALVCVQRKEQIEAIVKEANLARNDYAVLTADPELNALGCETASEARVSLHYPQDGRDPVHGSAVRECGCIPLSRRASRSAHLGRSNPAGTDAHDPA